MDKQVQDWRKQAEKDLDTAEYLFEGKRYKEASFFSQQTVEKCLKAVIIKKTGKLFKIHDLVKLGQLAKLDPPFMKYCEELTTVYIDARYPDTGESEYSKEETKSDIEKAKSVLQWAEKNI